MHATDEDKLPLLHKVSWQFCRGSIDFDEIWHADAVRPSWPLQPLKIWNFENPKWRRPPSWKNLQIAISQPQLDRFWRNLARWCSSTLLNTPTVKNLKFSKSKMAAAAILKNRKVAISQPRFNWYWRNLARWCISNLLTVLTAKNLKFYKSKMAAAAILNIVKWPYLSRSLSDFDEIWHDDAIWPF